MSRPFRPSRRIKRLAAELCARHLDEVLAERTGDLASARHVAGLSSDEMASLMATLMTMRAKLRADAGPFADLANREIRPIWSKE